MCSTELAETALSTKNVAFSGDDLWTTFEVIENGELERPLHHSEKILEQVLEWSTLDCPSSAFLVIKKFAGAKRVADGKDQRQFIKGDHLKFSDGSSKLLSGHKFQDKYLVLRAEKLLLYRDIKSTKAEKVIQLKSLKCYLGLKKKLKPPTSWGFTVYTDKQQWHLCCEKREEQVSWVTDIIRMKYGSDLCSKTVNSKKAADNKWSRGAAVTESLNCSKQVCPPMIHRRISLGDGNQETTTDAGLHNNLLKAPEVPHRRSSVDIGQPPRLPYPSPSLSLPRHLKPMPLPLPPKSGCKTTSKRPTLGGEGVIPSNLLNELSLVLSKTGRSAKNNDWQEKK